MVARGRRRRRRARAADRDVLDRVRRRRRRASASPRAGRRRTFLADQAREHGVWVGGSCPEVPPDAPADDQRPSNSFVLAGPDGTHAPLPQDPPVLATAARRSTSAPAASSSRSTSRACGSACSSATTCASPTSSGSSPPTPTCTSCRPTGRPSGGWHWTTLLQARAIENQAYVVGVNRVGEGGGLDYSGDSRIIDPLGELLATAPAARRSSSPTSPPTTVAPHPRPLPASSRTAADRIRVFRRIGVPDAGATPHETLRCAGRGWPVGSDHMAEDAPLIEAARPGQAVR